MHTVHITDLLASSRSIAKGKRATLNRSRSDVITNIIRAVKRNICTIHSMTNVTVCDMESSRKKKGRYESFTDFSEIEVSRSDS